MLTVKQEKFVHNLLQGMTQREAYKHSYNAENMLDKTIDEKACILLADGKVKARYTELLKELEEKAIMTAIEKRKILKDITQNDNNSLTDRLKAIDLDNKMCGVYVQKIQADVNSDVNINIELSDEE